MRRLAVILLGVVITSGVVIAGTLAGLPGSYDTYVPGWYGPYTCVNSCELRSPNPDQPTLEYIRSMDRHYVNNLAGYKQVSGDTFTVCTPYWCVPYTRSDSLVEFRGGTATPATTPGGDPNVGGGGEGGGASNPGGGGGYSGPIGGGYGGGGTVDVGPVIPIQNP